MKKLKLCLMVVLVLLKAKFGHTQISVPKTSIPILKTACINPWFHPGWYCPLKTWGCFFLLYKQNLLSMTSYLLMVPYVIRALTKLYYGLIWTDYGLDVTFTSEYFLKRKNLVESKFLMSVSYLFNIIKPAAVST